MTDDEQTRIAELNAAVSGAILRGERALDEAIIAYDFIIKFEGELAEKTNGLERDIACRGVAGATMIRDVLQALRWGELGPDK